MVSKNDCRDDVGGSTNNNDLPVQTIVVNAAEAIILMVEKWIRWCNSG